MKKLLTLCLALIATTTLWASNTINYTAAEKLEGYRGSLNVGKTTFGPAITLHTFSNGKGTITCSGEISTIGDYAFRDCRGLTSVTIPNSVTTIGEEAFRSCSGLTSVAIPNSVTTIGGEAFYKCSGLTSITIPNSVTSIGEWAFSSVNNIVYNGTATGSPWGAKCVNGYVDGYLVYSDTSKTTLCGCSSAAIGEITIPNSVTTIEGGAFYNCSELTSITIPNSVTEIGMAAFSECSKLTSVTIPNSVTTIGEGAFGYSGLTSITIPNSVITIGKYAFSSCQLTSITIGNSVTTIGDYAFQPDFRNIDNPILTSIKCFAVIPPSCKYHAFYSIRNNTKIYVLASSLSAYQSTDPWKDFQLLPIGADEKPIEGDEPVVTPTNQDVTITWPITDGASNYSLVITKNGEIVCTLTFNAQGQLLNIAFAAPGRNGAHQAPAATLTAQGYQFTVTGLNPGTAYDYSVTATDAGGKTLAEHKGNFSTTGGGTPTSINEVHGSQCPMRKFFHNGNLIIERNGNRYTPTGQKVK